MKKKDGGYFERGKGFKFKQTNLDEDTTRYTNYLDILSVVYGITG